MVAVLSKYGLKPHANAQHSCTPDFERLVGPQGWAKLHPAIRRRFSHPETLITYTGEIDIKANPVGLIFAALLLPFGNPLPLLHHAKLDAKVDVFPHKNGGVVWRREFLRRGKSPLRIESVKQLNSKGRLLECVKRGPLGGIGMELDVYEQDGELCFKSRNYFLSLGKFRIPVPHWLTPGHALIEHIDEGQNKFRFRLSMHHKLFGPTITQDGIFKDPHKDD